METITISKGWSADPGQFVSVRPCNDRYEKKTFLGIYVGDVAAFGVNDEGKRNDKPYAPNPCMWVPDLGEYIFGFESWWGVIESKDDLRQISNDDIDNVWYVQALKALSGEGDD